MAAAAPLLARYIRSYAAFLKLQKMQARQIREELRAARAWLAMQTDTQPEALASFCRLVPQRQRVHVSEYLAVLASTRFVPLSESERELFQAYAANTGNNHAAKLRNAAIISLLLNPTPPNVRPADVLQIQTEDLTVDHLGDPVTKIISYKARGVSVPLNENARGHLTAYMTDPSGYQSLKSASCNYIWPARGPRGGDPVKAGNQGPMHRHSLYELTRDIGALCGIRGRVGADILRKSAT